MTGRARSRLRVAGLSAALLAAPSAPAAEWFVSPSGSASGDGSEASPWDLQTALDHPSAVQPGDTIWLFGGTYAGTFTSGLNGTSEAPIVVRQRAGERATIDGGDSDGAGILSVGGSYTWYWGFEITSSDPNRTTTETGSSPSDIGRGTGVQTTQYGGDALGVKFINLVVHDTSQGLSFWSNSIDSEIYGCLIYYNGWDAPDRGHGHGIYTQNETGTKTLRDNIIFDQFSFGIHAYGSDNAFLKNFVVEGNVGFDNGVLAQLNPGFKSNILVGGEDGPNGNSILSGVTVSSNATYSSEAANLEGNNNVGYSAGCSSDVSIDSNVFAQNTALSLVDCDVATLSGNTFIGDVSGFDPGAHPGNTVLAAPPAENLVIVRPNAYEPGRANIVIYNWQELASVSVDLGPANVATGSTYSVLDAQDFFGAPVVTGTYDGSPIAIPMQSLTKAAPVGVPAPPHSAPRFGAFVLLSEPGSGGTGGAGGSAGSSGGSAGGTSGSGGAGGPAADGGQDDGGCGCRVGAVRRSQVAWALFAIAGAIGVARRRRRAVTYTARSC